MANIKTYIHGIYPRSSELIQVSRDLIRKRGTEEDYIKQFKKDFENFQDLQKTLDTDYIEDGKLAWHDIFRPIVESTQGFEIGALTRWFDNNTFFRQPVLKRTIKLDEKKLDKFFPKLTPAKKWKVTLPSPFTFAKLISNESGLSFDNLLAKITDLVCGVVVYLEKRGVSFVQFNEPFIPYSGASTAELKLFNSSVLKLGKVKGKLILAYHFYFGDAAPAVKALGETTTIDIAGVDFYKTALSSLPKEFPYTLAAGVVDGRNSLLEEEATLKDFINKASKTLLSAELYITNNSDLDLLPETIARQKIELLVKVRDSFK